MQCNICKQEITDTAYIEVGASIVIQNEIKEPIIFSSPAQRGYYNAKIYLHDKCWISLIGTKTKCKIDGGFGIIPVSQ